MTAATIGTMPSKGTKRRTIRIEDELWNAALEAAEAHGESLPDAIRAFLTRYVKRSSK
jgi:Arc/MetJ family transcription regulator